MLEVRGFRGVRYNPAKVGLLDYVITPPYDVISNDERRDLAKLSPYNLVHLILPEERQFMSRYESAGDFFETWLAHGVLKRDAEDSYYLLRQQFTDVRGNKRVRCGFLGVSKLPEPGERYVLGHERTFSRPIQDRLSLTEATKANLGPVFALYTDPEGVLKSFLSQMDTREPDGVAHTVDGVRQEIWRVAAAPEVSAFLRGKTLYIADGHHRFQTAVTYRDNQRKRYPHVDDLKPYDYVLMGFVALEDAGLEVYPTHRLAQKPEGFSEEALKESLTPWFDVAPAGSDLPAALDAAPGACVIGLAVSGGGEYLLTLKDIDRTALLGTDRGPAWRDLDVAVLHRGILENILQFPEGAEFEYEKQASKAVMAARTGKAGLAFVLRATRREQICACAEAAEPMPQKSTYFFPKLPSGVAINVLE